ncbi:MAG: MFS transporter [Planctomycetales bacterium]|nr:MFS transporter [Planctomycetales bacterium]
MNSASKRGSVWVWWICGLLLLASTINYMDRQTLSNTSKRITDEFKLSDEQYGNLELAFGLAFACGATVFGIIADKTSVRWLYPIVLLLWSMMGFLTGFVETYAGLLLCRLFLGLFEAGHWPCALKTTQRLLPPDKRTLGNSVLQSGTAIGAIITPLIMKMMLTDQPGSWRPVFQVLGAIGVVWVVLWLVSVRQQDLSHIEPTAEKASSSQPTGEHDASLFDAVFSRKFLVLLIVVISINACWHLFRVWLPKFLQQGRGYTEAAMLNFNFWFNVMTDVGCLSAGALTATLAYRGWSVHGSRCLVFGLCAGLVSCGGLIPWLPQGPALLAVLLLVGAGALGLFPCYYSLSQELTKTHQGKVSGLLGTFAWLTSSPLHPLFGRWIDQTKSFDLGMAMASLTPLVGFAALCLLWPRDASRVERL